MSLRRPSDRSRRAWSIALSTLGAVLGLLGGILLYARENIVDRDALADRAEQALSDQRVRLALAQPITDAILDSGPAKLVNARPVIESVTTGALGTPPVKAAVGESVKALAAKLFDRNPDVLLLNLASAASIAAETLEAVNPKLAKGIPKRVADVRIEITSSVGPIDTLQLADKVRLGGLLLPPLAVLMLVAAVAFAPDRRRALVRTSASVAAAAVTGLVLLSIGKGLLVSQFADDLVADAVKATWDALLGDLRSAFMFAGIVAIVLAAAARFTTDAEFDPLAPFLRTGDALRRRPRNPALAFLRALVLAAVALFLILRPELSLESVAVVAGAWVLYVAIGELLAILAPAAIVAPAAGQRVRRLRPGRVAAAVIAGVAVVAIVVSVGGESQGGERPPGPPEACNGFEELCAKRLDEVTFPATHNSMSAAEEAGWFLPNQRYGIRRQLDDGIRALLIDTHYGIPRGNGRGFGEVVTDLQKEQKTRQEVVAEIGEASVAKAEELVGKLAFDGAPGKPEPYLCHVLCELGATPLGTALSGIDDWMARHPDEFLILFIEDVVSPEDTAAAFEKSGLLRYAYVPEPGQPSPTLGELIERDQRLLVMAENDSGGGRYSWYQQGFDLVQETPYTFHSVREIESPQSCRPNRGSTSNPLFQINSWVETIPRDPDLAAKIDAHDALLERARTCTKLRGLKPNIIAVDFYDRGDVVGVSKELNGIPADAKASVRTSP